MPYKSWLVGVSILFPTSLMERQAQLAAVKSHGKVTTSISSKARLAVEATSVTHRLCDTGQVLNPLCPSPFHMEMETVITVPISSGYYRFE